METFLGESVVSWLSAYGYYILVPIMLFEGTTVVFLAGALSATGVFNPFVLFVVSVAVRFVMDTVVYYLSRWGTSFLLRFRFSRSVIQKVQGKDNELTRFIDKHFFESLFLAKVLPLPTLDTALLIAAGVMNIRPRRVYFAIFTGQPIWSAMIIALGYFFGDSLQNPSSVINALGIIVGAIILMIIFGGKYVQMLVKKTKLGQLLSNGEE